MSKFAVPEEETSVLAKAGRIFGARTSLLGLVLFYLVGCGGGTDGTPANGMFRGVLTTPTPTEPEPTPPEPEPEPIECTDERDRALSFGSTTGWGPPVLVEEWDGDPFLFYFDRKSVPPNEHEEVDYVLGLVEQLSLRLEEQLGYSVIEVGGWTRWEECYRGDNRGEQNQIVAYVNSRTDLGTYRAGADSKCAAIVYFGDTMAGRRDGTVVHEIFHLFGYSHSTLPLIRSGKPHHSQEGATTGYPMSTTLTADYPAQGVPVTREDVEALRCIFPKD